MENSMILKNLLSTANEYDLRVGDEIEIKISGTMILKERVPDGKKWLTHISIDIEEQNT